VLILGGVWELRKILCRSKGDQRVSNHRGKIGDFLSHDPATKITSSIRRHPIRLKFRGLALIITCHQLYIESLESVIPKLFESRHINQSGKEIFNGFRDTVNFLGDTQFGNHWFRVGPT
jgi:hypothetical protein